MKKLTPVEDRVKTICSCRKGSMDDKQYKATVEYNLTKDRNQAYTSLVEGVKAQVKDINGEGSVFDDFATDLSICIESYQYTDSLQRRRSIRL